MKRILTCSIVLTALVLPGSFLFFSEASEFKPKQGKEPNLIVDLSAGLVNAAVTRRIDRTDPVKEIILETPVCSQSRTEATLFARLLPDPCKAAIEVIFQGRVSSQSVGTRPHVLMYTFSSTHLEVCQRVLIDAAGARIVPGPARARTKVGLVDVTSRTGETDTTAAEFVWRNFRSRKEDAEEEIASKTIRRVANSMEEGLAPALDSANLFMERTMASLKTAGLVRESLEVDTSEAFLQARLRLAAPGRKSPGKIPPLPADRDVGLRVHESLFNEIAQAVFGGKTYRQNEVGKFFGEVTRGLLLDGRKDADKADGSKLLKKLLADLGGRTASITLAKKDPLLLNFTEQGFTADINIAEIRHDKLTFPGMRVSASYQLENTRTGVQAVRKGPVRYVPPKDLLPLEKKLEAEPLIFLLLREAAFEEILKERLILAALPLPDSISAQQVLTPRVQARNGWLSLWWKLEPRPLVLVNP